MHALGFLSSHKILGQSKYYLETSPPLTIISHGDQVSLNYFTWCSSISPSTPALI